MRRLFFLLSFFLLPALNLAAEIPDTDNDHLRDEIAFLTDSLCGGRATGSPGCQNAAFFLLRSFKSTGLNTFVQSFDCYGNVGHNVIGITPGWYRRYIVIGAYYDGLGTLGGEIYPGADSNASAVAALLELTRSLPSLCKREVGIIFVAFDAHNAGLQGSKAFLDRYYGKCRMDLMVNLDILASVDVPLHKNRPDYLIALGGASHIFSMDNANRGLGLDLGFDYYGSSNFTELFYRKVSDQRWFLEKGIPSVMFTSGITMRTNKTSDTADSLDIDMLSRRISFIARWISYML